ncbi:MAG: ECF-type sigma factor [Thermoanaerobaculia bacterium]
MGSTEITGLLAGVERGDQEAFGRLFELVYHELRKIAQRQLRRAVPADTLGTTALVHEAYLKFSRQAHWSVADRRHFFALAARAMRSIVVDHARRRDRQKRGGGDVVLELNEDRVAAPERAAVLLAVDGALARLERTEPDLAQLVEWRFFAGLSIDEIAVLLDVSDRTIKRRWRLARAVLQRDLVAQGVTS